VLGGTSNLFHLRTTAGAAPLITGRYDGPLYTADGRVINRRYRCAGCTAVQVIGPGTEWAHIAALKAAGCPGCAGTVFRPMALERGGLERQ
jgi:hypothetical protein